MITGLLRIRPNAGLFPISKKLDMNHIRVAANRAVFDIFLIGTAGGIEGDDDLLAAGWADVATFVGRAGTPF